MYTREASALDLFTDSVRIMGDATLCMVMEFDRVLDPGALEHAAGACLAAHPILHSRLVRGQGPAYWEMLEGVHIPRVHPIPCAEPYYPHVIGSVDPHGPLQFRARLLRRLSGDVIVINLSHAAADGFGLHRLASDLLREYETPGSLSPAEGGIPERDTLWTRELLAGEQACPSEMPVINPMWPDPFGTSQAPSSYHRDSVSSEILGNIRAYARRMGGNLNDVVMAAYFLTMCEITGFYGPIDLFFPVNLRQHLGDGSRVMANQANNVSFTMEKMHGEEMSEILPRVIEKTRYLKENGIGILEQVTMDRLNDPEDRNIRGMVEEMAALQRAGLADIFISNPGPFTLPDCTGLTDAYVCYPGGYMPTTCFVTSTFRGRMTVTMGYQDSERPREVTKHAMARFRHYLLSVSEG